jgi:predicted esterase
MRRSVQDSVAQSFFWIVLVTSGVTLGSPGPLQGQDQTYEEMRAEVVQLYGQEKFAEAAAILEDALDVYPDHLLANCVNLALMNLRMGTLDESMKALEYGLDHGIWYGKYTFLDPTWDPMKEHPGWNGIVARVEEAKALATILVEPRLEVVLPVGYDPAKQYPLFLALHGGGENVDIFMPNWKSPVLEQEFIVAFPQSTQLIAMDGYNWTEDIDLTLKEITHAFNQVVENYSVNTQEVIVGGFSSGGVASLEVVLKDALAVQGFVVLCPAMPENLSAAEVRGASRRGIRGTLLTTEMDGRLDQQRRMADIMKEQGVPLVFHVFPDIGHWYPEDLAERIDGAIAHIRGGGWVATW